MEKTLSKKCRSACPVANVLDVIGDRWTLLVIRDLFFNKHEYHELLNGSEKIATNILSDRLKKLCCQGVIDCVPHPDHKTKKFYYLTQKGKDLLPVIVEMILWAGIYLEIQESAKTRIQRLKRDPKKFIKETLAALKIWEAKHLR